MENRIEELAALLETSPHPPVIQTHDFPDYDAIAAAMGLKKLLEHHGIQAEICYQGTLPIFVRDIFLKTVNISMLSCNDIQENARCAVVVDTNPYSTNLTPCKGFNYCGFVDHHVENKDPEKIYPFEDLRKTGSTSSIITSYYSADNLPMEEETATALAIGLLTDTLNLTRGVSRLDLDGYFSLFSAMDGQKVKDAVINKLTVKDLDHYKDAIDSLEIIEETALMVVEGVKDRNLLGIMADFFLTLMEVSANIMVNITDTGTHISVRSENESVNAARLVKEITAGLGSGGGHWYMAGGFIPVKMEKRAIRDIIIGIIRKKEE